MNTSTYNYIINRTTRFKFYFMLGYLSKDGEKIINLGFNIKIVGCSIDENGEIIGGPEFAKKLNPWEAGQIMGTILMLHIDTEMFDRLMKIEKPYEFGAVLENFHIKYPNNVFETKQVKDFNTNELAKCYTILAFDRKEDAVQCFKELLAEIEKHTGNNRKILGSKEFFEKLIM